MTSFSGEATVVGGAMPQRPVEGGFEAFEEDKSRLAQPGDVASPEGVAVGNVVEVEDVAPITDPPALDREAVDKIVPKTKSAPSPRFNPFRGYRATEPDMYASQVEAARERVPASYVLGAYSTAWTDM